MAIGLVFGLVSVFGNMPMLVLVFLSSIAGAVGVVGGLMLLVGSLNSADFTRGAFTDAVEDNWVWYLLLVVLAVVGIVAPGARRPSGCAAACGRSGTPRASDPPGIRQRSAGWPRRGHL